MVNRELRTRAASLLASYMRSELTTDEYDEQQEAIRDVAIEHGDRAAVPWEPIKYYDDSRPGISVHHSTWNEMCRLLAFQESALEVPTPEHPDNGMTRKAVALAALLYGAQVLLALYLFDSMLPVLGVVWFGFTASTIVGHLLFPEEKPDQSYLPFRDHTEWTAHKHLLDKYDLPAYDPTIHQPRSRWYSALKNYSIRDYLMMSVCAVTVVLLLIPLLLWSPVSCLVDSWLPCWRGNPDSGR